VENGGCAIWFNEPRMLLEIEALVGNPIPCLTKELDLPEQLTGHGYGEKQGSDQELQQHLFHLQPVVEQLASLEDKAQIQYWQLQMYFKKRE